MCKTTELRILLFLIANQTNFQCLDPCHYERCFGNTRTKSTPKSTERRKLSIFVSKVIFQIVKRTKSKIYGITPFIVLPSILPYSIRRNSSREEHGYTLVHAPDSTFFYRLPDNINRPIVGPNFTGLKDSCHRRKAFLSI